MNLWSDDNSSVMEASKTSSDLSFLSPSQPTPSQPPQTTTGFNQDTLQQRLQAVMKGAEIWSYAIFWQPSYYYPGSSLLGWGDGFYNSKLKSKSKATSPAEQEHLDFLDKLILIQLRYGWSAVRIWPSRLARGRDKVRNMVY
ncbi:transcription factor MYC2-like [Trifolium medium]|uniref:Transcription factor n=1 Tax=Trifolium medium TaxID=97028 RepID=A0A392MWC8_9FABA|nr:transcription factor MYC2-like [Trifolium medium]